MASDPVSIARNSRFIYKGKPVKTEAGGPGDGRTDMTGGEHSQGGDRVRITVQLIDTSTGNHLCSDRYERDIKDIFAIQDEDHP